MQSTYSGYPRWSPRTRLPGARQRAAESAVPTAEVQRAPSRHEAGNARRPELGGRSTQSECSLEAGRRGLFPGFSIAVPGGMVNTSDCAAARFTFADVSSDRNDVLRRQTKGIREQTIPSIFEEARERLRPVVRSSTERGVIYLQTRGTGSRFDIAFRPLCENLEMGIAYDGESTIMRLTEHKLSEWNMTFDEAYDIAIDNLRLVSSKPFATLRNGVLLSQFGDHYDAACLLLTDVLQRQPISGAPVVTAHNRNALPGSTRCCPPQTSSCICAWSRSRCLRAVV